MIVKLIMEDGRKVKINISDEEIEKMKVKNTGWGDVTSIEAGDCYHCINNFDRTETVVSGGCSIYEYNAANFFTYDKEGKKLAKNIARAQILWRNLQRFQALNDEPVTDWDKFEVDKYHIDYDYHKEEINIAVASYSRNFMQIYFNSKEICEKAIEEFKDELMWYFTEFKNRMDY